MKRFVVAVLAMVVSIGLVWGLLNAATQINSGPLKVGVVDLSKVIDGYQKKKDREAELNKARDTLAAQLKVLQKHIESMNSEMELLDKKAPEYTGKRKAVLEKQEELLMKARLADREMSEKLETYLQEVYSEIIGKLEEYRAQNNFDFILRVEPRALSSQERIAPQLDRKIVLAYAKSFEISDDIIVFLNQAYTK